MYHSFHPGRIWLDTEGKPIHAHGGSVLFHEGSYYWYGENKEQTDGKNGIWHYGVRCYRSEDLYNWTDCGLIIPPDLTDENSPLHPASMMDRPHILYHRQTGKFVCWLKIQEKDGRQTETVLTSRSILGPYETVRRGLQPLGMNAGDFDLAQDENGKGYYYFDKVHSELVCAELNEDYTDVNGLYSTHFPRKQPPYVREGVAHFMRQGKHYLITSGTTGYLPNPSELAVSDSWHGPFTVLGDPHPKDTSHTSFHSQISCVFKVEGKRDLYIAMADRWVPDRMDLTYEEYAEWFRVRFSPAPTEEELYENEKRAGKLPLDGNINTSLSTYVWLPFRFDGDMGHLDWTDEWELDDFD